MTPHDLELKQFNEIMHKLDLIEGVLFKIMDHVSYSKTHKLMQDGVTLSLVYIKDAKDKFKKYGERQK